MSDPEASAGLHVIETSRSRFTHIRANAIRLISSNKNWIGYSSFTGDWNIIRQSDRNTFMGNHFSGEGGVNFDGRGNVIRKNVAAGNYHHGIVVSASSVDTLLDRNTASMNWGDGIQVNSPSTTLRNNVAHDNMGWGIWAVDGVLDGGGNSASGNAAGQCLNVTCNQRGKGAR